MMLLLSRVALVAAALFTCSLANASPSDPDASAPAAGHLILRPTAGLGYSTAYGKVAGGASEHIGGRVLLKTNAFQSYGIEVSFVQPRPWGQSNAISQDYLAVGIVLEQVLFKWFTMGIGTVGYIGVAGTSGRPFGIVTNLGYDPANGRAIAPFITYRSEWIFASPVISINSLSVGLSIRI